MFLYLKVHLAIFNFNTFQGITTTLVIYKIVKFDIKTRHIRCTYQRTKFLRILFRLCFLFKCFLHKSLDQLKYFFNKMTNEWSKVLLSKLPMQFPTQCDKILSEFWMRMSFYLPNSFFSSTISKLNSNLIFRTSIFIFCQYIVHFSYVMI